MAHLSSGNQLHEVQHGFRHRRSCVTQLLSTIEDWSAMIDAGDPSEIAYIDFSKTFDSVSHSCLIRKLQAYGVTGRLLAWTRAFLNGRWQHVLVNGCASDWVPSQVESLGALYLAHPSSSSMSTTYPRLSSVPRSCLLMTRSFTGQ